MRVFKERQAFRQWWLLLILSSSFIAIGLAFVNNLTNLETGKWKILSLIPVTILMVLFWNTRLHTKIGPSGIETRFEPFGIFKRSFSWNDISRCYIRQYAPLREYGGWGIRGLNKAKAYNVSGNMGIQIITKDNERFLIGTNKPAEAEKAIQRYHKKTA
ncbi:hypothetical protein [Gramella sp. KN1008]|uniref:hypothetical protein n=1 Tax=Gramella sp. KN1008 TaxID=2529298 RepID=UPI00103AA52B|nr:hypothetical protein [Gramella sp. KN1008]TBW28387.1 hypothetical protein EZJ28_06525 [Gramella sp. KN1008]